MIFVERPEEGPPVLSEEGGRGKTETQRAQEHLDTWIADGKERSDWSFNFDVYRDKRVKQALEDLFHGKCAYCESSYRGTQPMDVEHWRPKGRTVAEDAGEEHKPAYYWLAASWQNLLPSCIDCNRKRTQKDVVEEREVNIGKMDQFPLKDPTARLTDPAQPFDAESPLLLHPCEDDPGSFLEFVEDAVVRPTPTDADERLRATESIRVYALNRSGLVLNRQEVLRIVQLRLATVKALARILTELEAVQGSADPRIAGLSLVVEEVLVAELRELARARSPQAPFSLMARQEIDRSMAALTAVGVQVPGA